MVRFNTFCQLEGHCLGNKKSSKCYDFENDLFSNVNDFFDTFPLLEFQLDNNYTYEWGPRDYFYSDDNIKYCLSFEKLE